MASCSARLRMGPESARGTTLPLAPCRSACQRVGRLPAMNIERTLCCAVKAREHSSISNQIAQRLVATSLAALTLLSASSVLADGAPPTTFDEVPSALETIITEENRVIAREEENAGKDTKAKAGEETTGKAGEKKGQKTQVSLRISIDGEMAGDIVVRPYDSPPVGSQRFLDLARRQAGGYRLSRVDGISDAFITITGSLQLNYAGMAPITGGETVEQLQAEQEVYPRSHDRPGLVSLILEDAVPKDVRDRMVAYQGRLIKVQEVKGAGNANGTGLAITLKAAPELDRTNLVIGEVAEGLDVVERISKLPKVKSSKGSPFFKVAKALGDRRADVAARSFGKPFGKVIVQKVEVSAQ